MKKNSGKKPTDDDEVEQLLRAAQDDMLLKLSVNSHTTRNSAAIDSDLDRRFQALKKPHKPAVSSNSPDTAAGKSDLFTRFAALKSSIPSYSGKENSSELPRDASVHQHVTEEEDNDEDEVEKVINWAIDAARLDPSPPSEDDDDDDDDEDDDSSEDDREVESGKKGKRK